MNESPISGMIAISPSTMSFRRVAARLTRSTAVRSSVLSVMSVSPSASSRERRRPVDGADLVDHRLIVREAAELVAPERMLRRVEQALVAMRAGPVGQVAAEPPALQQIVVRHQRTGDRHRVEISPPDMIVDQAAGLPSASADHRDVHGLLDRTRAVGADA